jgi:hypothetical protein
MLFLISPAKTLDYETPLGELPHTRPQFLAQSAELIGVLKKKSPQQIASLMSLSDSLAALNVARYQTWSTRFTEKNSRQAALAFDGDVYGGLDARSLSPADLDWAQQHLCILSGLYGVLRPLDRLQPYRLEMGTRLTTPKAKDLYQFWDLQITDYLNRSLARDKSPVVVNLASQEYFKAVKPRALKARVVECVFEERKAGGWQVISFFAKRARGLMARHAIQHRISTPAGLQGFNLERYQFDAGASEPQRLVFRRESA